MYLLCTLYFYILIKLYVITRYPSFFRIFYNIIDGGIIGISIMISYITKVKLSILTFVLNIPFLILGYKQLGKSFIIKAAYAMLVFSILLEQFKPVP